MRKIDFEQMGGMPLKQPTLDFMQESYKEMQEAFIRWLVRPGDLAESIYPGRILAGVEHRNDAGAGVLTPGWIIRDGLLLPFAGCPIDSVTTGGGIGIQTVTTQVAFKDGSIKDVYELKMAVPGGVNPLPLTNYQRVINLADLRPVVARNFEMEVPVISAGALQLLSKSMPEAKVGDVVVVSVAAVAGLPAPISGISDWVTAKGRVTTDGQLSLTLINGHASQPAFGGWVAFNVRILK